MARLLVYFLSGLAILSCINYTRKSTLLLDNLREKDEHDNQQNRMSGTLEKPEPASSLLYQNGRSRTFIESQPIHTPILFLLCHDRISEAQAIRYGSDISRQLQHVNITIVPYVIPSTLIDEYYFYTNILGDIMPLQQNTREDWIAIISFDSLDKHRLHVSFMERFFLDTDVGKDDMDVILTTLVPYDDAYASSSSMLSCCQRPDTMMEIFPYILTNVGESSDSNTLLATNSSSLASLKIIDRLGFMIRAKYIPSLTSWISRAFIFITSDPRTQQLISQSQSNCNLGWSIYPHLGRLLVSYFLHSHDLKVSSVGDESSHSTMKWRNHLPSFRMKNPCINKTHQQEHQSTLLVHPQTQTEALQSVVLQSKDSLISMLHNHIQLQSLLKSKNLSMILFVLWSDGQDSKSVSDTFSRYPWAQPLPIPSNYLMDHYFYTNMLEKFLNFSSLSTSWIGSIHWDDDLRIDITKVNDMLSDDTVLEAGIEVLSFHDPLFPGQSIHKQAEDVHPGLMNLMEYVLRSTGERKEDIDKLRIASPEIKGVYSYSFACRPILFQPLIQWLSRVTIFLMTDMKAQEIAWGNSSHEGDMRLRMQVYGSSYFPLHFVTVERLISYYFNIRGSKIMTIQDYKPTLVKSNNSISQTFQSVQRNQCLNERYAAPPGLDSSYSISLFYHIGMVRNWREIVEDQLSTLENCGLGYMASSITLSYNNPQKNTPTESSIHQIQDVLKKYLFTSQVEVNFIEAASKTYERPIMEDIASFCQKSVDRINTTIVFYFHNKGSSKYVDKTETEEFDHYRNTQYWRKYMEYFLLERPTLCARAILNHGTMTCGVNMRKQPSRHYSGNFWAASCNHLKGLTKGDTWPKYNDDFYTYISAEMWIGNYTHREDADEIKYLTLFNIRDDLYGYSALPREYTFVYEEKTYLQGNHSSSHYNPWDVVAVYDPGNQTAIWLDYESGLARLPDEVI